MSNSAILHALQNLWFARIIPRFDEFFIDCYDLYPALSRPLFYMLDQCESHNIIKVKPWIQRIMHHAVQPTVWSLTALVPQFLFFHESLFWTANNYFSRFIQIIYGNFFCLEQNFNCPLEDVSYIGCNLYLR